VWASARVSVGGGCVSAAEVLKRSRQLLPPKAEVKPQNTSQVLERSRQLTAKPVLPNSRLDKQGDLEGLEEELLVLIKERLIRLKSEQ
jgi:hypothetical protein